MILIICGTAVLISALFLIYKYIIYPLFISPLSKIPCANILCHITPAWISWKRSVGREIRTVYPLHQKFGAVVRLAPNEISLSCFEGLRTVYLGGFEKNGWYEGAFMNFDTMNLVSMQGRKEHSVQKRMVSNVYSKSYLQNSEDLKLVSQSLLYRQFLPILEDAASKGGSLDVFDLTQALGMDVTSGYLFGTANMTNFLGDAEYRHRWYAWYEKTKYQTPKTRANGPVEQWCMDLCNAAEAMQYSEKPISTTQPVVHARLYQCLSKSGLHSEQLSKATASELLDELLAGHETSAVTLTYLMYQLSQRPSLQDKLRNELLTLSPPLQYPPQISTSTPSLPHPSTIDTLPLLDAVINETLRLNSAAAGPLPRVTPNVSGGTSIAGYDHIPGGITISCNAYSIHRQPTVFPDPEKWDPERWLRAEGEDLARMKRNFFAFGAGGRMCLGKNLALMRTFLSSFFFCPCLL